MDSLCILAAGNNDDYTLVQLAMQSTQGNLLINNKHETSCTVPYHDVTSCLGVYHLTMVCQWTNMYIIKDIIIMHFANDGYLTVFEVHRHQMGIDHHYTYNKVSQDSTMFTC